MIHIIKAIISIVLSLYTYSVVWNDLHQLPVAGGIAALSLLLSLLVFYGEGKVYPKMNVHVVAFAAVGALVGAGVAYLLSVLMIGPGLYAFPVVLFTLLTVLGIKAGADLAEGGAFSITRTPEKTEEIGCGKGKILDTSVIIDGRILDIADTHFIDGPLILPNFVIREIQLISDSSDPIKRARGRRGLELLNKLQKKGSIEVKITYTDYADIREVDQKLIRLARDSDGAKIVTNDFNLNKVAELQGVAVLNLNNLANALKPVVLPGEELQIQVIKEGKDENQGIGYLEDGTMVVIENGGHLVGKDVKVNVTSIIQTAAGKMIFTKVNR